MKVKINNKSYVVPELMIGHYTVMEDAGFSILDVINKRQVMLMSVAFVCAIVGCDRDGAEELLNQHILGGGNILDIADAFDEAIGQSDFFKRMLGIVEEEKKPSKKTAQKSTEE